MALEDFFEDLCLQDYESVSDGMGGLTKRYFDKTAFRGGCSAVSTREADVAYSSGTKTVYRLTIPLGVALTQGDVVRRARDGRLYRITSNASDRVTPDKATIQYAYVTAEVIQ